MLSSTALRNFIGLVLTLVASLTLAISARSTMTCTDVTPLATLSTEWTYTAVRR
jgi:hypothetical protein